MKNYYQLVFITVLVITGYIWFTSGSEKATPPQEQAVNEPVTNTMPIIEEGVGADEERVVIPSDETGGGSDIGMEFPKIDLETLPVPDPDDGIACTMDAKQCPDGSYVGRVPPSCAFSPCPTEPASPSTKTIEVTGKNFAFSQSEIRVKRGDTVTINFTSTEGFHDWVVDEFSAKTEKVQTGGTTSVTFVADKSGIFEYYCSVGSHRANGMVGNLIVE